MDWKDTLKNLQTSGTLPEGPETLSETPAEEKPQTHKGKLHIAIEKKGRGGKTATIIYGFNGSDEELQELASTLRHRLGTGGSARGGEILLQGDSGSRPPSCFAAWDIKYNNGRVSGCKSLI